MRSAALSIAVSLFVCLPAAAQLADPTVTINDKFSERIDIGISTNEIAISSDFSGADITVFGAIDGADELLLSTWAYDVVVALEGPRKATTVRRKERVNLGHAISASTTFAWFQPAASEMDPV